MKHYYVRESVGIAVGFLLASLHASGLATLTHTPSPMGFLGEVLNRPANERAFVLILSGTPSKVAWCPISSASQSRQSSSARLGRRRKLSFGKRECGARAARVQLTVKRARR